MSEIKPLRPGVWLVQGEVEDFQVRGAVLVGTERVVVWDSLARPADMVGVAELSPGLPLSVVYSHGDWDHVWGTAGLSTRPQEIIAHDACRERFLGDLPETLEEKRKEAPGSFEDVRLIPPNRTFPTTLTLDLGGISLELHHLPGHTPDSIVGFVPEWGIFLAGDTVETPLPFLNPGNPLEPWVESLGLWAHRLESAPKPPTLIPSHGRIGGPELLRENERYLRDLLAGRPASIPKTLTRFYRETHLANLALIRQA